jgi:L-lactate dehydrogenase complex protein LldE
MKIAFFATCVTEGLYPDTGKAVVSVLERLGHEVIFPAEQTCCGQMHFNSGYQREGFQLARRFLGTFDSFDVIVSPSASCVGTVRDLYARAAHTVGTPTLQSDFESLAARVYEFSEFLTDVAMVTDVGARFPHRVAYHPTCHSLRVLGLRDAPRVLLSNVRDLTVVDFKYEEQCCGFGGTFSLKNSEASLAMGTDKVTQVRDSGAEVLCAVDNSCLTHLGGIATRQGAPLRVLHLAEILASRE